VSSNLLETAAADEVDAAKPLRIICAAINIG
jgi:hypothetical protein